MFRFKKKIKANQPLKVVAEEDKKPEMWNEKAVVEAFTWKDRVFYMYETAFDMATGRGLAAVMVYDEFAMKCDADYLKLHCSVVDKIFQVSVKKALDIGLLVQVHANLKERLGVAVMPDYVYKLASVFYFDKTESPYLYDVAYGEKKIEEWKTDPDLLGFFLTGPLANLMPFANIPKEDIKTYLKVAGLKDKLTRQFLLEALSKLET